MNTVIDDYSIKNLYFYPDSVKCFLCIEFLSANAITVNGEVIQDENYILEDKKYNIIRRGKKKYFLIEKDL